MTHPANDDAPLEYEEQAAEWCWRIADRALTDTECDDFDAWINADPRHRAAFDEMVTVWKGTDAIADMPGFLSLRARALTAMEDAREPEDMRRGRQSGWREGWYRAFAAAAAVTLMVMGGVWYLSSGPDVYATGLGERQVVRLADGSSVSLDASSRVTVDYSNDRRVLALESGRAKFDVAKDPLRPFTVTAAHKTVVATGTAFSVELLRDQMRVLLYEGHVSVLAQPPDTEAVAGADGEGGQAEAQLSPGQEFVAGLSSGTTTIASADMVRSLSWEGGRLTFIDEPLARAVERVNRYAETPIVIGDAAAGAHLVNGVFDAGDTRGFISGVTAIFPVNARARDGETRLVSTPSSRPES